MRQEPIPNKSRTRTLTAQRELRDRLSSVLDSYATPFDPLTITRDFYLLIEYIERTGDAAAVDWQAYKRRCHKALETANVWGFEKGTTK